MKIAFNSIVASAIYMFMYTFTSCGVVCAQDAAQIDGGKKVDVDRKVVNIVAEQERVLTPQRQYSLNLCFKKADDENKDIAVAKETLPIADAGITIAGAIPNPVFSMEYGFGHPWSQIVSGNMQQFGWTQEFQVAGKRRKKIDVAKAQYYQNVFQLAAVRFTVHNQVRRAYAELAAAEAYAELVETQRAISQQLATITQKRFLAGASAEAEYLQAKLAVLQFDTQRNTARSRLVQASAALLQLLGEAPTREEIIGVDDNGLFRMKSTSAGLVPEPNWTLPELTRLLPAAYNQRNDLKAAIQQAYAMRKALILARTLRIPDPNITAAYQFSTYKKNQNVNPQRGVFVQATEEAPVLYQYQGEIKQAEGQLEQADRQVDRLHSQIATDIVTSYEAVAVSRASILNFQNNLLPAAEEVARLGRRGFELGLTDIAAAMIAQQQYEQTRSSYFDSVVSYQNAWADLEKAMGVPLNL